MALVTRGVFAGMDTAVLQPMLLSAQLALIDLMAGKANVQMSYTQGDGGKSITKKMGSVAECTALIQQLQIALGIECRTRRPIRFVRG